MEHDHDHDEFTERSRTVFAVVMTVVALVAATSLAMGGSDTPAPKGTTIEATGGNMSSMFKAGARNATGNIEG